MIDEKSKLDPAAAAKAADLAIAVFFDDAGDVETGQRLDIAHHQALRGCDQNDLEFAAERDKNVFHPRVEPAGKFIDVVKQRDLFFQRNVSDGNLYRVEVARFALRLAHGHRQLRLAIVRDVLRRARREFEIFYGHIIGKSIAGFGLRQHPDTDPISR